MEYYTYAYLREDGTPYYIGKGKNDRAFRKRRLRPESEQQILILKSNLSEKEAFKHEIYMIAVFGRKDKGTGILRNRTNGGEGTSNVVRSKETIEKQSKSKMGYKNPMYGKKRPEHSEKMSGDKNPAKRLETRIKQSKTVSGKGNPAYGRKWWVDENNNRIYQKECPGDGWINGMVWKSTVRETASV